MASTVSVLPKIFRWDFMVLSIVAGICALVIFGAIVANPHLPAGAHFGPLNVDFGGQPGTVTLRAAGADSNFIATAFRGTVTFFIAKAVGLLEVVKHYGLPVLLIEAVFFTFIFELLCQLFRNVGRGESFSPRTVRLVQGIGLLMIVYSFVLSFAVSLFAHAVYAYFAEHAVITVSGSTIHLSSPHNGMIPGVHGFPFNGAIFFSGLLVLALSEVFRQGLALKKENELTI